MYCNFRTSQFIENARPGSSGAGVLAGAKARNDGSFDYGMTTDEHPAAVRMVAVQPAGQACPTV